MSKYKEAHELLNKVWAYEYKRHTKSNKDYITDLSFQDIIDMSKKLQKTQSDREKMRNPTIVK